jgi:5,10-methylene-tetrahydrofolate dehydrogenase/methenyl tetrahydrofolate cyclohydrolase
MPAIIIDGKAIAEDVRASVKSRVASFVAAGRRAPCLAVVLVGARPDSATYVRNKKAACAGAGITDRGVDLPETASEAEVLAVVEALNADPTVDGILVQLPLPKHVDEVTVLRRISLEKDADGLHPLNVGALALKGHAPRAVACTPKGCMELLRRAGVAVAGKRAVVLGRSNIVGIPMALLLLESNATVTVCHSRTEDLPGALREVRGRARGPPQRGRPLTQRPQHTLYTHPAGRYRGCRHWQGELC